MDKIHARVKLRENDSLCSVTITSPDKPAIHEEVIKKWQDVIDICARIMNIPSALIMKLHEEHIEVFLRSNTESSPYSAGDMEKLGIGLYCETVVAQREFLLIPDARKHEVWKDNPDVKLNMVSYLGMPLVWPDKEVFGTICVLDCKENNYSQDFIELLLAFRRAIETDLRLMVAHRKMNELAYTDQLTRLANRRSIDDRIQSEFNRAKRYNSVYSLILFDIDNFKSINDAYGHHSGDEVLVTIASLTKGRIRGSDLAGRWGGEEFIVICSESNLKDAATLAENIRQFIETYDFPVVGKATCSFGVSSYQEIDECAADSLKRADDLLYEAKRAGKNKVLPG